MYWKTIGERVKAKRPGTSTIIFGLIALLFAFQAAALVLWLSAPPLYDPWGDFPIQQVDLPITSVETVEPNGVASTFELPTLDLSEGSRILSVTGTKCVNSEDPVVTGGEVNWSFAVPPGFTFDEGSYPPDADRPLLPGCTTQTFQNELPDEVAEHAELLFSQGYESVVIRLHGTNVAYKNGEAGAVAQWSTENFALVP